MPTDVEIAVFTAHLKKKRLWWVYCLVNSFWRRKHGACEWEKQKKRGRFSFSASFRKLSEGDDKGVCDSHTNDRGSIKKKASDSSEAITPHHGSCQRGPWRYQRRWVGGQWQQVKVSVTASEGIGDSQWRCRWQPVRLSTMTTKASMNTSTSTNTTMSSSSSTTNAPMISLSSFKSLPSMGYDSDKLLRSIQVWGCAQRCIWLWYYWGVDPNKYGPNGIKAPTKYIFIL